MNSEASSRIWGMFSEVVENNKTGTALITPTGAISFAELYELSEKLAEQLSKAGINAGDIVCHTFNNNISFVIGYLALCRISATVALVSSKYQREELASIIQRIKPKAMLCDAKLSGSLENMLAIDLKLSLDIDLLEDKINLLFPQYSNNDKPVTVSEWCTRFNFDETVSLIKFTSGSTGEPKAVALSAANILSEARNIIETLGITPNDNILATLPLSHSYGFDLGILPMILGGAGLIAHESFVPRLALQAIASKNVTIFLGVPSIYRFWSDMPDSESTELSGVRLFLSCTAPLNKELITTFHKKFDKVICQHYGSSETGAAANQIISEILTRPDSVGAAMKNVTIEIIDSEGRSVPSGEIGEVVISGDNVAIGYLMGAPASGNTLKDGHYQTGDLGYLDNDRFLFLTGRKDQLINVGGNKVSPQEVINILERFPGVKEAGVLGIKDNSGEEIVVAMVTSNADIDESNLLEFCRGNLAPYKIPRRITIKNKMPKGATGKIRLRPEDFQQ